MLSYFCAVNILNYAKIYIHPSLIRVKIKKIQTKKKPSIYKLHKNIPKKKKFFLILNKLYHRILRNYRNNMDAINILQTKYVIKYILSFFKNT